MGIEFLMWPLLLLGLVGYDFISEADDDDVPPVVTPPHQP